MHILNVENHVIYKSGTDDVNSSFLAAMFREPWAWGREETTPVLPCACCAAVQRRLYVAACVQTPVVFFAYFVKTV